jgi:hypothetical protein
MAPASGSRYAIDSQFIRSVRGLADRFEHRLFLSATPHNGHSNSFSALLEILDPQRFTRGVPIFFICSLRAFLVVPFHRLRPSSTAAEFLIIILFKSRNTTAGISRCGIILIMRHYTYYKAVAQREDIDPYVENDQHKRDDSEKNDPSLVRRHE